MCIMASLILFEWFFDDFTHAMVNCLLVELLLIPFSMACAGAMFFLFWTGVIFGTIALALYLLGTLAEYGDQYLE